MKKYLGVDLGGTNVRVAVVSELGEVLEESRVPLSQTKVQKLF